MAETEYVTVSQAMRILKSCSESTIRRYMDQGLVTSVQVGVGKKRRHRMILRASLASINPLPQDGWEQAADEVERREREEIEVSDRSEPRFEPGRVTESARVTGNAKAKVRS